MDRLSALGLRYHALVLKNPLGPVDAVPVADAVQRLEKGDVVHGFFPPPGRVTPVKGGVEKSEGRTVDD